MHDIRPVKRVRKTQGVKSRVRKITTAAKQNKNRLWMFSILAIFALVVQIFAPNGVFAAAGSVKTTDTNCVSVNVNSYAVGDHVWVNATGFDAKTLVSWDISPVPSGSSVASGSQLTDSSGNVCFDAYVVAAADNGEYKVTFADKTDNYQVKSIGDVITPTPTPTPPQTTPLNIFASKVVCESEADLPNWGGAGTPTQPKPAVITSTTASDYVANSNGRCHLQPNWSFQYGFAEKNNQSGVDKLPGDFIGPADGTSTLGQCNPTNCGNNTFTGTGYADWKNFDTSTSNSGITAAQVSVSDLQSTPGIWVREDLQAGYIPFSYPPDGAPGSDISAEMFCHNDIQNFDNYDQVINPVLGQNYYCVAFNAPKPVTIKAYKVVCLSESDLPDWGDGSGSGKPAMIDATTASDFVAASDGKCSLAPNWSFQYGFAEKNNQSGVDKLPGDFIGPADGTSTLGQCNPTNCGNNTFTGTGYADWKNFDTSTSGSGAVAAQVNISDLQGAPGVWVREDLQKGYIPFSYPPDGTPGSNVSAEMYCHNDIQNFDNYDQVVNPVAGTTYYCIAFNAPKSQDNNGGGNGGGGGNQGGNGGSTPTQFTLTVQTTGDGEGVVTSNDGFINCDSKSIKLTNCTHTYNSGDKVTLTATANPGSTFADTWFDACSSNGNNPTCDLTMSSNLLATAHFSVPTTNNGGGGGGGCVSNCGGGGSSFFAPTTTSSGNGGSGGGGSGGGNNGNGGNGVVNGISTTNPNPGGTGGSGNTNTPKVLGATLPRTGQPIINFTYLLFILFVGVFFVPQKKRRVQRVIKVH
jgi:hypothetical protein